MSIESTLDARFKLINKIVDEVLLERIEYDPEDEQIPIGSKKYEELKRLGSASSLYRSLESMFRDPSIGTYLSPAKVYLEKSIAYQDLIEEIEAETGGDVNEKEVMKIVSGGNVKGVSKEAYNIARTKINNALRTKREEIMAENDKLSTDEANLMAMKSFAYTKVPGIQTIQLNAQYAGDNPVFMKGVAGSEATLRSSVDVHNAYHDPSIGNLVRFGKLDDVNVPIPPSARKEAEITDKLDESGIWTPTDLNILCYGSKDPLEKVKPSEEEKIIGTSMPKGMFRDLFEAIGSPEYNIGRPSEIDRIIIKNLKRGGIETLKKGVEGDLKVNAVNELRTIDDIDVNAEIIIKNMEEGGIDEDKRLEIIKELRKWVGMREEWVANNGDLRNINDTLMTLVVKHIIRRMRADKNKAVADLVVLDNKIKQEKNEEAKSELSSEARGLRSRVDDIGKFCNESNDGKVYIQVGGNLITGKIDDNSMIDWKSEKNIFDQRDKTRDMTLSAMLSNADVTSRNNISSILKRVSVADNLVSIADKTLKDWVYDKVYANIYDLYRDNKLALGLNIGSDPSLINQFIGSIDQVDDRFGIGAKLSWRLIEFIDLHKQRANLMFKEVRGLDPSLFNIKVGDNIVSINQFEDFKNWKTGVKQGGDKVQIFYDKKKGRSIYIDNGEDSDETYISLAMMELGKDFDDLTTEVDYLVDKIEALDNKLNGIKDEITNATGDTSKLEEEANSVIDEIIILNSELKDLKSKLYTDSKEILDLATFLQKNGVKDPYKAAELVRKFRDDYYEKYDKWIEDTPNELGSLKERMNRARESRNTEELDKLREAYEAEQIRLKSEFGKNYNYPDAGTIDQDTVDQILSIHEIYPDYNSEQLAKIATKRFDKNIYVDDVDFAVKKGNKGNILKFAVSSINQSARKSGMANNELEYAIRSKMQENSTSYFIEGVVESIVASIELGILTSSYTQEISGRGLGTSTTFSDVHNAADMLPGFDVGDVFGDISNPSRTLKMKNKTLDMLKEDLKNQISKKESLESSGDFDNEEMNEIYNAIEYLNKNIELTNVQIEELKDLISNNEVISSMAENAEHISSQENPYLPANRKEFNNLLDKMEAYVGGVDVEWDAIDISMIKFLNRHTPLLQSMGSVAASAANRYLYQYGRSIDYIDINSRSGLKTNKPQTDEDAVRQSNFVNDVKNYVLADKSASSLYEFIKSNKLLDMDDVQLQGLCFQMAKDASGAIIRNGLCTKQGKELYKSTFVNNILSCYDVDEAQFEKSFDVIYNKLVEENVPDDSEREIVNNLMSDTMLYFNNIINGASSLTEGGEDLAYTPSGIESVLETINKLNNLDPDSDEFDDTIRSFMEFVDEFEGERDIQKDFANITEMSNNIVLIDNIIYYLSKEDISDDEQNKLESMISKLDERGVPIGRLSTNWKSIESISTTRTELRNRITSIIEDYKNSAVNSIAAREAMDKLWKFVEVVDASEEALGAKIKYDRTGSEEEKDKFRNIEKKMSEINSDAKLSIGVDDEAEENIKQYKERVEIYKDLISIRNGMIGEWDEMTGPQRAEAYNNLLARLKLVAKEFHKSDTAIAQEFAATMEDYMKVRHKEKEIKEKTAPVIGVSASMMIPDLRSSDINVKIYPFKTLYDEFVNLGGSEVICKLYNPLLFAQSGKSYIGMDIKGEDGFKREDMSIVIGKHNKEDIEEEIDFLKDSGVGMIDIIITIDDDWWK